MTITNHHQYSDVHCVARIHIYTKDKIYVYARVEMVIIYSRLQSERERAAMP